MLVYSQRKCFERHLEESDCSNLDTRIPLQLKNDERFDQNRGKKITERALGLIGDFKFIILILSITFR
ncbi:MAG: hypothetical protein D6B25_14195 [Desulfobulbaceae bacterium]|nr:MAG: hypothetical protein D6B25_14195 [Desulfobulbaceae bacterium]